MPRGVLGTLGDTTVLETGNPSHDPVQMRGCGTSLGTRRRTRVAIAPSVAQSCAFVSGLARPQSRLAALVRRRGGGHPQSTVEPGCVRVRCRVSRRPGARLLLADALQCLGLSARCCDVWASGASTRHSLYTNACPSAALTRQPAVCLLLLALP